MSQQASSPGFDPAQTERRFDQDVLEQSPATRDRVQLPKLSQKQEAQADSVPLFVLRGVSITGASTMPPDRFKSAYSQYIGKEVSQTDLSAIAAAIGDVYRSDGFHLSRAIVPPQDIQTGSVHIEVIEGQIAEIILKGEAADDFGVRELLAPLLAEHPSQLKTLERRLMLVNNTPGARIQDTTLDEIGDASGRFRLTISLKTWDVYAAAGLDNLGSSSVGPWQSYLTTAYNSVFVGGDTLAVNLSTTPGDFRDLAFIRMSYDAPVGDDGVRVGASGVYSEVRPGDYRRTLDDITTTESIELRGSFTPIQFQRSSLVFTAALGASELNERNVFGPMYNDHIRTLTLTSDYRLQDNFGGTNYLTVALRQGLDIFGASAGDDALVSHLGAAPTFSAFNGWFTRYQTLNDSFSLKIAGAGQLASGPLYLSQQFYLGGLAFGRGYGSAEISGDNGMAGSAELRFDKKLDHKYIAGYQLYSFIDTGVAWNDGYRFTDGASLTSVGGGLRVSLTNDTQAEFGAAVPLTYRATDNYSRDVRFLFSLTSAIKMCPTRASTKCL